MITQYAVLTSRKSPGLIQFNEIISHPTFLTTLTLTSIIALTLSGLFHLLGKKEGSRLTDNVTTSVTGFRVGKKTGAGS